MFGIIGAGNMGGALVRGMISGGVSADHFCVYDLNPSVLEDFKKIHVNTVDSVEALLKCTDTIMIAVKPVHCAALLEQISKLVLGHYIVSIVTGWSLEMLSKALPTAEGFLRMMPNTPAAVGAGVLAIGKNTTFKAEKKNEICGMLEKCGRIVWIDESQFDAVTCVSGSGPAYVYMFIEALADGGVKQGLSRTQAYQLASQTVLGAAKMVLETGAHPAGLKDAVCSPAGTTIDAVYALEKDGFRAAVIDAVQACADKLVKMRGDK